MARVYSMRAVHQRIDPLPPDAIYVGRAVPRMRVKGSRWGNQFRMGTAPIAVILHEYADWLAGELTRDPHALDELAGRDLACWCTHPSQREPKTLCHASMLLVAAQNPEHWLALWHEAREIEAQLGRGRFLPDSELMLVNRHALLVREMEGW